MKKVHFVAIGGQGMSGIARILLDMGYKVTGSDLKLGSTAQRLMTMGAKVFLGHRKENIENPDVVVVSSAINPDNPEVLEAKMKGIPIIHRMDMLLSAVSGKRLFAVAGAHGKTTTTSMLAWILEKHGLDPTYLVGGEFTSEGNAHLGQSDLAVVEVDESDGSFLKARPYTSIVTNIDNDHMEYWGSMRALEEGFRRFLENTQECAVVCSKDPFLRDVAGQTKNGGRTPRFVTYAPDGQGGADWCVENLEEEGFGSFCQIQYRGQKVADLRLNVPGLHNVEDALGAIAAATYAGVDPSSSAEHLLSFRGAKRRLELIGEYGNVTVIDDFAHHPNEIKASLMALRKAFPSRKVHVIFQPHRYSRTKALQKEFGEAFDDADSVTVVGIYAGPGEAPDFSVGSSIIADSMKEHGYVSVEHIEDMYEAARAVSKRTAPGDVIVTMGAGDVWKVHEVMAETLRGVSNRESRE